MSQSAKKILIVDDDESAIVTLAKIFKNEGYIVDGAATGEDALIKLKTNEYDLIISDIEMPVYDGLRLFMKVRETSDISFILMSGGSLRGAQRRIADNNVSHFNIDWLVKPFKVKDVIDKVQQILGPGANPNKLGS